MQRVQDFFFSMHIARWWLFTSIKYAIILSFLSMCLLIYSKFNVGVQNGLDRDFAAALAPNLIIVIFFALIFLFLTTSIVFVQFYRGITVSIEKGLVSWPASRDPNTISDIMFFKKYWKHLFRQTVDLSGLIDIRNNTVGPDIDGRFKLDITWDHGGQSHKIEFASKQRRDQCRAMLLNAKRQSGARIMSDPNSSY